MFDVKDFTIRVNRGDTGSITIHTTGYEFGPDDRALFTIKDGNRMTVRKEVMLRTGNYVWDVRFVVDPEFDENDMLVGGTEVYTPHTNLNLIVDDAVGDV